MYKIKECCQQTAADILTKFSFVKDIEDLYKIWEDIYKQYDLKKDPYTYLPVSTKEYIESVDKYYREKYE